MTDDKKKSAELEVAELRKAEADAVKAEIEAEKLYHELREQKRIVKRKKQDAKFEDANESAYGHGIYRFAVQVNGSSVFACKDWITTMRRYKPGCDLRIEFNSGGGSVLDGLELFDAIREASDAGHRVTIVTIKIHAAIRRNGSIRKAHPTRTCRPRTRPREGLQELPAPRQPAPQSARPVAQTSDPYASPSHRCQPMQ